MIDLIQHIYNGILRFSPLKKQFNFISGQRGFFPQVGFLTLDKKKELEKTLGISIARTEFFEQALIHRSYLQVSGESGMVSNERLEFLGDAVLDLVIAEYLFSLHTIVDEGELTKMRSWLVNKKTLALAAKRMQLDSFLMLSFSASKALEKGSDSILSDALEAVIGAIYFDKGIEGAKKFILNSLLPLFTHQEVMIDNNYKSIFLEKVQSEGKTSPWYNVIEESGPDHDKQFLVGAYIGDELISTGEGKNKKDAEQSAARNALTILDFRKANNLKMAENFNN